MDAHDRYLASRRSDGPLEVLEKGLIIINKVKLCS
jgi:hypothetical protein